jgi:hypothetical protein
MLSRYGLCSERAARLVYHVGSLLET